MQVSLSECLLKYTGGLMMPGRRPTKKDLAKMKVMSELGISPTGIAAKMGKSHHTIQKYLQSDVFTDPTIKAIVEKIRDTELNDLYLLGAKGRQRLHELLDSKEKVQMIPTIALVDRTFQQRRLLEGRSTMNLGLKMQLVLAAEAEDQAQQDKKSPQGDEGNGQEGKDLNEEGS